MAEIARWLVAVPAGLLFLLCCLANWSVIVGLISKKIRSASLALPFLGPIFGLVFFFSVPATVFRSYWWLSFVLEPTWLLGVWIVATSFLTSSDKSSIEPVVDARRQERK